MRIMDKDLIDFNAIISNSSVKLKLIDYPLIISFAKKELKDFSRRVAETHLKCGNNLFNQKTLKDLLKVANLEDCKTHTFTILDGKELATVRIDLSKSECSKSKKLTFIAKEIVLKFENVKLIGAVVNFNYFNDNVSRVKKQNDMTNAILSYFKNDKNFKINSLFGFYAESNEILELKNILDEKLLIKNILNGFVNINLTDILNDNASYEGVVLGGVRTYIEVRYERSFEKSYLKRIELEMVKGRLECKDICFFEDDPSVTVRAVASNDKMRIYYYGKNLIKLDDNVSIFFKYKENAYPKVFKEFVLIGDEFDLFNLERIPSKREPQNHFNDIKLNSEVKKAVLNYLLVNMEEMEISFNKNKINVENVIGKKINEITDEDYDLLKFNFNEIHDIENSYFKMKENMDCFYNSLRLFKNSLGLSEHFAYLEKNISYKGE
jgi:hypothetical protein